MKFAAALTLLAVLAGCAEINKPIRPNDPWGAQAEMQNNPALPQ
ncbi:hypothetical protein NPA31_018135 [Aurantimonas sp. MSK8Z-1]|nr:hypothetical protein [Aurantimonas sp. MSK8Z-1]MCW4116883.1 hypothetical protein [Aurantimonas sp. MSK8Z-1]